jgi:hypothetical protein
MRAASLEPSITVMQHLIDQCERNFRKHTWWDLLNYLRVPKPSWLAEEPDDRLSTIFRNATAVFRHGTIVWGYVVQANRLMYEPGDDDCPGELVYSLADAHRVTPDYLHHVASRLSSLKGTEPSDPALAQIADYLTDELIRVYGLPVPSVVSPHAQCQISTTFFLRKHLPGRYLLKRCMPIVVNPREPFVALPLPERYWPEELVQMWFG